MLTILPPDDEAQLILDFLGETPGYFVDVGAHDPKIDSQSWHLEQLGWSGILVEPQPGLVARLQRERKAAVYAVACTSPDNAGRLMPLHLDGVYSSLNMHLAAAGRVPHDTIDVATLTLDQVLSEAGAPAPIDFLSIDVEGHTLEVLAGTNLTHWRPRLLLVEDHVTDLRLHRHMVNNGFRWLRRTGLNSWYVPAVTAPAVSLLGRCQFVRKYYLGTPFRRIRDALRRIRAK